MEDDGKGFDLGEVSRATEKGRGLGLMGMRERVALFSGNLTIDTAPGAGTQASDRGPSGRVEKWQEIRVLIVDDHAILREGIRALLSLYPDIEVVGEAEDGLQAISMTRQLAPDIVLMDIAMPGLGGLEATVEIRKQSPDSRVVILTQHDDTEYIFPILKAGASGYVLKKAVGTELVAAIRAVHRGESFLYPSVATAVIEGYLAKGRGCGVQLRPAERPGEAGAQADRRGATRTRRSRTC